MAKINLDFGLPDLRAGLMGAAGAVGNIGAGIKNRQFMNELAAIDTKSYEGQIEYQQKLLAREKDPRVRLQMQNEIADLRKLQERQNALEGFIQTNNLPEADAKLLRTGMTTPTQILSQIKSRKKDEALEEAIKDINATGSEEALLRGGLITVNQILGNREKGADKAIAINFGKSKLGQLTDGQKAFLRKSYVAENDDIFYETIGNLSTAEWNQSLNAFGISEFAKGLEKSASDMPDKDKSFYLKLADNVRNRVLTLEDAQNQIKMKRAGYQFTVPQEYKHKSTGEIKQLVKVSPKEGDDYMAIVPGDGSLPRRVDINDYEKVKPLVKAYKPTYGTVTDKDLAGAVSYIENKYDVESNDYPEILPGLLAETANFVQKNSEKAVNNKEALEIAEEFLQIKPEGGNIFIDADIIQGNLDVKFEELLQKIRPVGNDPLGLR